MAAIDAAIVGPPNLRYVFAGTISDRPRAAAFVQFHDESREVMFALARANMGALNCYEPLDPDTSGVGINEPGYRGEQYLLDAGTVSLVEWTPNRLAFDLASEGPNVLVVNQNHDASWRLAAGRGEVMAHEGLLAVRVPAGTGQVALVYHSNFFVVGVWLALGTLAIRGGAHVTKRWLPKFFSRTSQFA